MLAPSLQSRKETAAWRLPFYREMSATTGFALSACGLRRRSINRWVNESNQPTAAPTFGLAVMPSVPNFVEAVLSFRVLRGPSGFRLSCNSGLR